MRRLLSQILILLSLTTIPTAVSGLFHSNLPSWRAETLREGEIMIEIVHGWTEPVLWLDARSTEAYEVSHIPGALLLNEDDWGDLIEPVLLDWEPGVRIVVYCDSRACRASEEVAGRLRDETGWPNVYTLHGGWAALAPEVE